LGWNGSPTGAGSVYATGYTFASKTLKAYNWKDMIKSIQK
jgi:hypothetical protein